MNDVCDSCGERNPPHTAFCESCNNYLGWEVDVTDNPPPSALEPTFTHPEPASGGEREASSRGAGGPARSAADTHAAPPVVTLEPGEWVVTPGAGPIRVPLQVANESMIVDAYRVVVPNQPDWMHAESPELRLLPNTHENLDVVVGVIAGVLVPVQRLELLLRVESLSTATLHADVRLYVDVGVVRGEMGLQVEPTTVRAKDSTSAQFRIVVDNKHSNESLWASLKGSDPEGAVNFTFSPPHLNVPAGRSMAARLHVDVPLPEPGREMSRTLTITAAEGQRKVETSATLIQSTSAEVIDPPMPMRLDPSLVRVENRDAGSTRVVADNRRGSRPRQVKLAGYDDERAVTFSFSPATMTIPPGQTASAEVHVRAPRPGSGQEAIRPLTVTGWDGEETVKTEGTFHQVSSDRRPMARILLTLVGAAIMLFGIFLPWTSQPALGGDDWTYPIYGQALGFDTVPDVTDLVPDLVVSGGLIVVLLSLMTVAGLIGTTGKMTRVAAVLCLLWIIAFVVVLSFTAFNSGPATGAFVIGFGCVVAFVGGLLARR